MTTSGTATFEFIDNGYGATREIPAGLPSWGVTRVIIWSSHDTAVISRREARRTPDGSISEHDVVDARVPVAIGWLFVEAMMNKEAQCA